MHFDSHLLNKKKIQKYLAAFYLYYFIWHPIYQSTTIYLTSVCLSWGAVPRKGLTSPLTHQVARCCYLCAGAAYLALLGSPTGSIPWFHNWGKYLPLLRYIIPPSPRKYRRSSSYHQGELLASLSGRIFNITRFLITNLIPSQFTLFFIFLSLSSPPLHKNLPLYSSLFFRSPFFLPDLFLVQSCCVVIMNQ